MARPGIHAQRDPYRERLRILPPADATANGTNRANRRLLTSQQYDRSPWNEVMRRRSNTG